MSKKKHDDTRISLHPLSFKEAIAALAQRVFAEVGLPDIAIP